MPKSKLQSIYIIPPNDKRTTFGEDERLPSLPLPNLKHTLTRYVDSIKPFIYGKEYTKSVEVVRAFEEGIGKRLHEKLKIKADKERNWVEKWWEKMAYLEVRLPLLPYCCMDGVLPKNIGHWTYGFEEDQIKHASIFSYYLVQYWCVLRKEELIPSQTADKKTSFSMSQYRRLFNTARIPGERVDLLISYFKTASEGFCPATVIIICKGRLFCMNAVDAKGDPVNPFQWEKVLREIYKMCNESDDQGSVAILTCDNRTNWSKNRVHLEKLSNKNKEILELIDKSLFVVVLDDDCPETDSDVTNSNMCGNYFNRWSDKSMSMIFYKNGRSGAVCDHTAFDGIVVIACHNYVVCAIEEAKDEWDKPQEVPFVPEAKELIFKVDKTIENEINRLKEETQAHKREITMTRNIFEDYGKLEIQRLKFHPDTYVQMCLQLAYFEIHKKPAPCYETATTRKFYNGRTETLRCCTVQCLEWVNSMVEPKYTNEDRKLLFEKAVKRHDELMNEARENAGCDRHLFGMYCTALEEGIEIPELYLDPAYLKSGGGGNFVLSTSCTGYTPLGGGVAPMCINGYGVFYNIMPNKICFTMSANNRSRETNAEKLFSSMKNALRKTRQMLLMADGTKSKI